MADAARRIAYTQPFGKEQRDLGAQPRSASLRYSDSLREVMEMRLKREKNSRLQQEGK